MAVISHSPFEFQDSIFGAWVLGVIETSINRLLQQDEQAKQSIQPCIGRVVRIKSHDPYASFYLLFTRQGLQVLSFYDGHVDARITATATRLIQSVLYAKVELEESFDVQYSGDLALIRIVLTLLQRYNLWAIVQKVWVELCPLAQSFPQITDILPLLQPEWLQRLAKLPAEWQHSNEQMAQLVAHQRKIDVSLRTLHQAMLHSIQPDLLYQVSPFIIVGIGGWLIGQADDKTAWLGFLLIGLMTLNLLIRYWRQKKLRKLINNMQSQTPGVDGREPGS